METDSNVVRLDGVVEESLPGLMFRVAISPDGGEQKKILAHLAGKMKIHYIRIVPGDRVQVEMPNIKDSRGRIVRRY